MVSSIQNSTEVSVDVDECLKEHQPSGFPTLKFIFFFREQRGKKIRGGPKLWLNETNGHQIECMK